MIGNDHKPRAGRRGLSEEDRALWRGVTRSVAPLKRARPKPAGEAATASESPAPSPARKRSDASPTRMPSRPATAKPAPPLAPIERRMKQRLARGVDTIDARLDLHGKTQSEAHAALLRFLRRAQADGARVALIITGKGKRGEGEGERGVLKRQVPLWLTLPEFRPYVIAVDDAHVGHGGQGALYVRVRKARTD